MSALLTKKTWIIILTIAIIGFIAYLILPVSVPLILAFITALFLEPLIRFIQKRGKSKRNLAVIIVFCLFLLFIGIITYFIVTKIIAQAINLVENAPDYIEEISAALIQIQAHFTSATAHLPEAVSKEIQTQITSFTNSMTNSLSTIVNIDTVKKLFTVLFTNIPNFLVSLLVYLIALFLFMIDMPRVKEGLYNHLTEKTADKVDFMIARLSYVVFGFLKAQFLVSVLIFLVSLVGLLFIAPEVALLMSIIIWVIDFIPIIGSIVILGPWALFNLLTGNMALGTELAILAAILLVIRRTVEPKVMGSQIGLSPLATLIAMYLGLKLIGILGFFVGPLVLIAFNSAKEAGIIKFNFKI